MRKKYVSLALAVFVASVANAGAGIHIDASSDAAAERSYQRMVSSLDGKNKEQLVAAVIQLNMVGVNTASEAPSRPSAARIKDKIGGMTAAEIIDLAHRTATNTTVTVERGPGRPVTVPGHH